MPFFWAETSTNSFKNLLNEEETPSNPAARPIPEPFVHFCSPITNRTSLEYPFNSEKNGLFSCHVLIHSSVSGQEVADCRKYLEMYEHLPPGRLFDQGPQLVSATESRVHFGKGCTSGSVRHCPPDHLESLGVEIVIGGDPRADRSRRVSQPCNGSSHGFSHTRRTARSRPRRASAIL